ncbi:13644_t:CDS:2 [Entrophospora sp. SA101]|nr:13644_t:CDS:2 [Entrophospora sp. SA101]CAJ0844584.1 20271_t:CDS:2 [Entrophospora sp. SA101]
MEHQTNEIKILEFFCGIGGMHYAFNLSGKFGKVVAAFDINIVANAVYKHNFNKEPIVKGIDSLSVEDIEKYNANCWFMSPPCQPYTRGGKFLDDKDPRSKALLHLINILPKLSNSPKYIFLENKSKCRDKLVSELYKMNYEIHECLLTPLQFGIPNDRLRYYLMACKRNNEKNPALNHIIEPRNYLENSIINTNWPFKCMILDNNEDEEEKRFKVPEKYILKSSNFRFDIVRPTDKKSSCFTKSYGSHNVFSSGSLIQTKNLEVKKSP